MTQDRYFLQKTSTFWVLARTLGDAPRRNIGVAQNNFKRPHLQALPKHNNTSQPESTHLNMGALGGTYDALVDQVKRASSDEEIKGLRNSEILETLIDEPPDMGMRTLLRALLQLARITGL
jgi:hypothetical protein